MRTLILACALVLGGLASSDAHPTPSFEYGPEFEARFLERCAANLATETTCRRFMERLQAQLGYPLFLQLATTTAEILERVAEERIATGGTPGALAVNPAMVAMWR